MKHSVPRSESPHFKHSTAVCGYILDRAEGAFPSLQKVVLENRDVSAGEALGIHQHPFGRPNLSKLLIIFI